jgi:hypothetical protein
MLRQAARRTAARGCRPVAVPVRLYRRHSHGSCRPRAGVNPARWPCGLLAVSYVQGPAASLPAGWCFCCWPSASISTPPLTRSSGSIVRWQLEFVPQHALGASAH